MLLRGFLTGLCLASALEASPIREEDHSYHEIVRFKRNAVLSARDLELADMHSVNLTEMWKHSVVKRRDGDDITIWVDNNFQEAEGPENNFSKRQSARLWPGSHYSVHGGARNCDNPTRWDITSATSPFTGGIIAMRDWLWEHRGTFMIGYNREDNFYWGPGAGGWGWRTLMIGGSNSGRNARYRMAIKRPGNGNFYTYVGDGDIWRDLDWTHERRRQFGGRWRAASHGEQWCGLPGSGRNLQEYQVISFDERV